MADLVANAGKRYRIAVAWAQDTNTLSALDKAVKKGFIEARLIGKKAEIVKTCRSLQINTDFEVIESHDESEAAAEAVRMARDGEADIVMKGLVNTDKFLKAVLNKETGLMLPDAILSYVCAIQIPSYHKLLFVTDPAVLPVPDLRQKIAMTRYALEMAGVFGIDKPRVALISASEKVNKNFASSVDYPELRRMADEGEFGECIVDGPLDLFLACDKKSVQIKGVPTPVNGEADILLFPTLEASNPFYKGLMLFAGGELAGLIRGTSKPVVMMSRSESEASKFYCIALACLMAGRFPDLKSA